MKATKDVKKLVEKFKEFDIKPDAQYIAAAGADYGWIEVWKLAGKKYLVYWGDGVGSCARLMKKPDFKDDLPTLLEEMAGLNDPFDIMEYRANLRGSDVVLEAKEGDTGPFYILETRYWYGPYESSSLIRDNYNKPLEFDSIEKANDWVNSVKSNLKYRLSHNEYSNPSYKVVVI
jgi:hypothetical protein